MVSVDALMFKHKSVLLRNPGLNPAWGMCVYLSFKTFTTSINDVITGRGGVVVSIGALMFKHKSVLLRSPGSNPTWGMF